MTPLLDAFRRLTESDPTTSAMISADGRVTTRAGLATEAARLADLLRGGEVVEGAAVAVQLPNSTEFIATFLAIRQLGATMIPIDRDARESEVAGVMQHFSCSALVHVLDRHDPDSELRIAPRTVDRRSFFNGAALLKLTSGSTGLPKGVVTSEANLAADGTNICRTMEIRSSDVNLGAIPFSHSYGFSNLVVPLLLQGTQIVFSNDYLPLSILELANLHRCTIFPGIPMIFDHLSKLPEDDGKLDLVRTVISAGAPLSPAVATQFRLRFGLPIHSFYGCSETGGISYDRLGGSVERGTVGSPLDGVTLEIDDATGRLLVSSPAVARGYAMSSDDDPNGFDESSSFLTEDLATIREDGELELTGRSGDFINAAGKKVNPREVESTILQIPGVREVKVFGEPAGARGEIVVAAVVAAPAVTREVVRSWCREHLSSYKVPRVVKLLDALPRDERGKVKRAALQLL